MGAPRTGHSKLKTYISDGFPVKKETGSRIQKKVRRRERSNTIGKVRSTKMARRNC